MRKVLAFKKGSICTACRTAPTYRAIAYAPLDEARKRLLLPDSKLMSRDLLFLLAEARTTETSDPELVVKLSETYSCATCWPELSRALSIGPSWVCMDIAKVEHDREGFVEDLAHSVPLIEAVVQ